MHTQAAAKGLNREVSRDSSNMTVPRSSQKRRTSRTSAKLGLYRLSTVAYLRIVVFLYVSVVIKPCSRKNFTFFFGALINLTVKVDAYFHPIRMTYPIHPGPVFRAAPNWGKAAKHSFS